MEDTLEEEEQNLSEAISPHSIRLSKHVRHLAFALRDKTETTPFAADTLVLANEVGNLCDYVEHLHDNVETLLSKIEATATSAATTPENELSDEQKKAIEIQREVHQFNPTLKNTIKALFMWRDSPEERLRDDK